MTSSTRFSQMIQQSEAVLCKATSAAVYTACGRLCGRQIIVISFLVQLYSSVHSPTREVTVAVVAVEWSGGGELGVRKTEVCEDE